MIRILRMKGEKKKALRELKRGNKFLLILCILVLLTTVFLSGCSNQSKEINPDEDIICQKKVKGGNSIITTNKMSLEEAKEIANDSVCAEVGTFTDKHICEELRGRWNLGLDIGIEGCDAYCVVDIDTKKVTFEHNCK